MTIKVATNRASSDLGEPWFFVLRNISVYLGEEALISSLRREARNTSREATNNRTTMVAVSVVAEENTLKAIYT